MTGAPGSFRWQVPTRVVFGADGLRGIGEETAALGSRAAVLVDAAPARLPVLGTVLSGLAEHGVARAVVVEVHGPPQLGDLRELVDDVSRAGCDVVLALGGGSTMDRAKVLALATTNPGLLGDPALTTRRVIDLDGADRPRLRPALPALLVPTTTATGSELNTVAAVWHEGHKRLLVSGLLAASTALIDPNLSGTLPRHQLAEGGVETFARLACPYLVPGAALPTTDLHAEALAAHCLTATDAAWSRPADLAVRADLAWLVAVSATQLPGLGRAPWGHVLWYLQDAVAELTGARKGPAMAALLPAYLTEVREATPLGTRCGSAQRLGRLAELLSPRLGGAPEHLTELLTARLRAWGLPTTLGELGLGGADLAQLGELTHRDWGSVGRLEGVRRDELDAFYSRARHCPPATPTTPVHRGTQDPSLQRKGDEHPHEGLLPI